MLTTLLLTLAAHGTPPPQPQPGRIEGLHRTYVTPSTFVPALRPAQSLDRELAIVMVTVHDESAIAPIVELLQSQPDVANVDAQGPMLRVYLSGPWRDLGLLALDPGTLAEAASLSVGDRPLPLRLPSSADQAVPTPVPTEDEATGWDLVLHNPHLGGLTRIAIGGLEIGEAKPQADITLHDVQPGLYDVAFRTHTGLERTRAVATQLQH
jgi:hypothetical protein